MSNLKYTAVIIEPRYMEIFDARGTGCLNHEISRYLKINRTARIGVEENFKKLIILPI